MGTSPMTTPPRVNNKVTIATSPGPSHESDDDFDNEPRMVDVATSISFR